jgi:hypothetical protein
MTPLFRRSTLGASTTPDERMHTEEQRWLMGNDTTYLLRESRAGDAAHHEQKQSQNEKKKSGEPSRSATHAILRVNNQHSLLFSVREACRKFKDITLRIVSNAHTVRE